MTAFSQQPDPTLNDFQPDAQQPIKRPPWWSPANWPVRWKVVAIVVGPLLLAATLGGLSISSALTDSTDLRRAADRAETIPPVVSYLAALEDVMAAATAGTDPSAAVTEYDERKTELREHADRGEVVPDVRAAVDTLLDDGQDLVNKVVANAVDLRQRVTEYAPLLLTAETAITGSVRDDAAGVRQQADALARAVGARGQMTLQEMLVTSGGDVPEPELRTSMITLAGTEPSTANGMITLLGSTSDEAVSLRTEMVRRMSMMSDPAIPLAGNPELLQSQQVTDGVAADLIADTVAAIPAEVGQAADTQRAAAIRDAVLVAVAIAIALAIVLLVARSLVRPLRTLRDSALKVAHTDLARELDEVRAGGEPLEVEPIPVHTTEEVGQVAHAVDELHEQAVFLAAEQTRLQMQIGDMFETLSRRNRSLVDQQLALIDRLERNEEDPDRLENLFRLDHLAARMRRNGANLLVLAGARVPRDQTRPVPVASVINAAASEVEDYTRVVTDTMPDTEVVGSVAGDLVHLLAELLDNALHYSPPKTQVRVSAVHAGNGALVIEVSDTGLGMTASDLRMANARLESGGEVDPYTARHMGLFVVGRLAAQHGLVVRLRATVTGEPSSGTTAGVYVPVELIAATQPAQFTDRGYGPPADAPAGFPTAVVADDAYGAPAGYGDHPAEEPNDRADVPVGLLPQRAPGASGIADLPGSLTPPPAPAAPSSWPQQWPDESMPAPAAPPAPVAGSAPPSDTSAFFAFRDEAVSNAAHQPEPDVDATAPPPPTTARHAAHAGEPSPTAGEGDAIYQKMLSEWLVDPTELSESSDLNWQSVWDHGWSKAAEAEDAPVGRHTDDGLPVREPGARLVPGGIGGSDAADGPPNGEHRDGGAHGAGDRDEQVASAAEYDTGAPSVPLRDPDAVRASISNHFGGVHAGRSHARETRGTDHE